MNHSLSTIIELVGVPGSGKTLAAQEAIDLLKSRGIDCVDIEELERYRTERGDRYLNRCNPVARLWHFADLYRHHPSAVLRVRWLGLLHGAVGRKRWRKTRRPLSNLLMIKRLPAAFPGRVVVLDDGFLQKLWSVLFGSRQLRGLPHIQALLAHYYGVTGVRCIRLDIPDVVAEERAFARDSKGRFNREAGDRTRAVFAQWLGHHRAMMDLLPPDSVIARIDATATPRQVAAAVADSVQHAIEPHRRR